MKTPHLFRVMEPKQYVPALLLEVLANARAQIRSEPERLSSPHALSEGALSRSRTIGRPNPRN
jgi:hypothetical protein